MTKDNFDYTIPIKVFGEERQKLMMIEECSELIKAILKEWRTGIKNDVIEELADVQIMINQMLTIYDYADFEDAKDYKLQRLNILIENKKRYDHDTKK